MKRKQKRVIVRGTAVLDSFGSLGRTPEEEVAEVVDVVLQLLPGVRFKLDIFEHVQMVPEGTDLLFFDYGGASGGFGTGMLESQSRALLRWAEDHPSALIIVISTFTWRYVRWEIEGLCREVPNVHPLSELLSEAKESAGLRALRERYER